MKIKSALFVLILISTLQLNAQKIKASSFGYNPKDATEAFVKAVQADFDTIIIDKQTSDWNVKPNKFFDISNKVIIFEPGVVLRALPNTFRDGNSSLFWFVRPENLTVIGYGAEFIMNKYEVEQNIIEDSEWRHAISIKTGRNVTIKGLTVRDACGDGVYVNASGIDDQTGFSKNIYLEDLKIINSYRQGLSIISVENMFVKNCLFTETKGTLPEGGVGIEPNLSFHRVVNVNFENCSFTNNNHAGIVLSPQHLNGNSPELSINFKDCYLTNNHVSTNRYIATEILLGASYDYKNPVKGKMSFERVFVENSQWRALYSRKGSDSYYATFKDCVFKDVCKTSASAPITLGAGSYGTGKAAPYFIGGFDFNNVLISYKNDEEFLHAGYYQANGVNDISGQFKIINPNLNVEPRYVGSSKVIDVDFEYDIQPNPEYIEVALREKNSTAIEATNTSIEYELTRSGSTKFPLGVNYEVNGEALSGDDYNLQSGRTVMPSGSSNTSRFITPRKDGISETVEDFSIVLKPSTHYKVGSKKELFFQIYDDYIQEDTEIEEDEPEDKDDFALRINAGGPKIVHEGKTFDSDRYFDGGKSFKNSNTSLASLYETERSSSEAMFSYNIPLANGTYEILLHFAEIYWGVFKGVTGGAGKRVFDVDLEGETVLNDFDISKAVGSQKEFIKTFTVVVDDGVLNLDFYANGADGVDQPKLSALEIIEVPDLVTNDINLRINSGGPSLNYKGETFSADQYYKGGQSYKNTRANVPSLYQTERSSAETVFDYNVPLENGTYEVALHFAEIYWGASGGGPGGNGKRIFDVDIEGVNVLNDYDINKDVGAETAVIKTFTVKVFDEVLNINFDAQESDHIDQPSLAAIEIKSKTPNPYNKVKISKSSLEEKTDTKIGQSSSEIKLFPNPAVNFLSITGIHGVTKITVFSVSGKALQSFETSKNEVTFSLEVYQSGLYLIQILNKGKLNTFKFIKL